MFFLGYLFFYSVLSTLIDTSVFFSIVSFLFTSIFAVAPFSADFPKSCSSLLTSLIAFLLSSASFLLNNFLKNPYITL